MLAEFEQPIDHKLLIKTDKTFELKQIDLLKVDLFNKLTLKNNILDNETLQLIWDIFFRLEDIQKCIVDFYNHQNGYLIHEWNKNIFPGIEKFLDDKTLLYSGLSRIYSVFDKLSRYISSKYKLDIKYFKDLENINENFESNFLNKATAIANSNEYKLMYILRNRIAHNLSSGALMGSQGIKNDNYYIFYCLNYLIFTCYELISSEIQNIGTN